LTIDNRLGAAMTSISPAQAASPPQPAGQMTPLPRLAAARTACLCDGRAAYAG
jgi:hypothetical protein